MELVVECFEKPTETSRDPSEIGHPQLHVVKVSARHGAAAYAHDASCSGAPVKAPLLASEAGIRIHPVVAVRSPTS